MAGALDTLLGNTADQFSRHGATYALSKRPALQPNGQPWPAMVSPVTPATPAAAPKPAAPVAPALPSIPSAGTGETYGMSVAPTGSDQITTAGIAGQQAMGAVRDLKMHPEYAGADIQSGRDANGRLVITGQGTGAPSPTAPAGRSAMDIYQNERRVNQEYYDRRMANEATNRVDKTAAENRVSQATAASAGQAVAGIQAGAHVDAAQIAANAQLRGADIHSGDVRFTAEQQADAAKAAAQLKFQLGLSDAQFKQFKLQRAREVSAIADPAQRKAAAAEFQSIFGANPYGSMGVGMIPVAQTTEGY